MQVQKKDSLLSDSEQSQKIELFISCRNLADLDIITVTDSFLTIKLQQPNKPIRQILQTKVYWNDLNPNYAESITIDFYFEIKQKLLFEVYHQSQPPKLVGRMQSSVGEIFGSTANGLVRALKDDVGKQSGKIIVRCEKVHKGTKKEAVIKLGAEGLPNIKTWWFFGNTRPFFRIIRQRENDQLLIYQSQIGNGTSFDWKQFKMSQRRLCKNDDNFKIEVRYLSYSDTGNHTLIGKTYFSLNQCEKKTKHQIKDVQGNYKGTTNVHKVQRRILYDFGDYIQNGLQLALTTCIDFTASNGQPKVASSLHYITADHKSPYQQALAQVLNILLDYDYDKLVPAFGFGAKVRMPTLNSMGKVHHCFPLNGRVQNPNLFQKEGILKAYRQALPYLDFSGPTQFSGLLQQAMEQCRQIQSDHNQYMILFILTDGQIHDREKVIDQLIQCGRLPISIIIVGIGNGEFNIMHELDDDDCKMVDSKGNHTIRDLVQFVQFKQFKNNSVQLAREVLEELPRQVTQYFALVNIKPQDIKNKKPLTDIDLQKDYFSSKSSINHDNPYASLMKQQQ